MNQCFRFARKSGQLFLTVILCGLVLSSIESASAQQAPPSATSREASHAFLAAKLPASLRADGIALLSQTDDAQRARMTRDLCGKPPAQVTPFLLAVLETDPSSQVRNVIVDRLGRQSHPGIREALRRCTVSDPDAGVAMLALERLRSHEIQDLSALLKQRMEMAKASGDAAGFKRLAQEQERWISLARGTMLPSFLRVVPAPFSLVPPESPIRVLAFGDYGNGSVDQKKTAAAMLKFHRASPFNFAITLGDNFYGSGMESTTDPRWKGWWDELYNPLGIKFYATLGNHDWGFADSPAAEILYTANSPSWRMPSPYYTFMAGPVQFFALDTNEVSEAQLLWLKENLEKSRARWKVVYGHHPIYSAGAHADSKELIARLLPVVRGRADVYFAGHDHDLQHLRPEEGCHFFVSGGGGAGIRPITAGPRSLFAGSSYAFSVIEADTSQLKISFVDSSLNQLYSHTLKKELSIN